MKKQRLFRPILFVIIALFLGTSLAFGIAANGTNDEINNDLSDVATYSAEEAPAVLQEENSREDTDSKGDDLEEEETESQESVDEAEETSEEEEQEKQKAEKTVEAKEAEKAKETIAPAPEPASQEVPESEQMARVTASGLNVRPDPSTDNERIDVLAQGQTVEVLAKQNDWLQVSLPDGRAGWIAAAYVTTFSRNAANGNGSLAGRIIAIDPGHGGTDPGAVGVSGLPEKDVVLDVSLRVADKLRAEGAQVIMTRDTDVFIPLSQRVNIAQNAGAEVFVSVHANAHPNPATGGTETYYFRNKASASASFNLASYLQNELVRGLGLRDIGVKHGNFLVIRQTSMPSALVELGFLSNSHEESLMRTSEFRQNSADAIVRGLKNYFN
ncbi:N-acetylmuramoyl-L-alanine amidase [Dethiobacter alkaliphilus]|uniref:N-acetylmuramoyl-L-alanine amidase n=1 Tax=Dethiobacter alkaliphilus AHT 1 TaxID=555088 RepID=C0GFX8_DETAL|nr:N-acetylmuramoyl-L-alanine amidase [Dethiobacter alkaliphilus]EEG77667.1 N-acetylmuramoyl-L-alanine amidase [Dethiobacter alkaliphilus AHT 1]